MGTAFCILVVIVILAGWFIYKARKFKKFNDKVYLDNIRRMSELNSKT